MKCLISLLTLILTSPTEPTTLSLFALGLVGVRLMRRHKKV